MGSPGSEFTKVLRLKAEDGRLKGFRLKAEGRDSDSDASKAFFLASYSTFGLSTFSLNP